MLSQAVNVSIDAPLLATETKIMTEEIGTIPLAEQIADRVAIHDILNLHNRGLDRRDKHTIQSVYWEDATVDYGNFKGNAHVFANLVVGALDTVYELTRHSLSNTLIQFSGEKARCESTIEAGHLLLGAKQELVFHGRYLDTLAKRGTQWKIMQRQVVMDWSKRISVMDERNDDAFCDLAKGAHLDRDPLYPFLNGV